MPSDYQAHHIVPKEMEIYFGKAFDELGINLDDAFNGTMLPPVHKFDEVVENAKNTLKDSEIPANFWNRAKHQSHPQYNDMIKEDLSRVFKGFEKLSKSEKELVKARFYKVIDDIIKRGDDVRFVSDPKSADKLFVKIDNKFVKDELGNDIPTIFSQEIDLLLQNGYKIEGYIAKKIK